MAMNQWIAWVAAIGLLGPLSGSAALAGPLGTIDDFSDTSLAEYTASYILEQSSVNAISFASPSGVLQVSKGTDPNEGGGAEQVVFLRNDYTLGVNEILRVDMSGADTADYVDFGLVVANTVDPAEAVWTSGTVDVRTGVLAIYLKPLYDSVGWLGRDGDATPGTNVGSSAGVGVTWANVTGLYIQRKSATVFSGGWTDAGNYHQLVEWSPVTDTNIGNALGFFADLRPTDIAAYGDLDNLRIVEGLVPGDVDGDLDVDLDDFNIIQGNFYNSVTLRTDGDLNADGIVNFADFREWKDNYPGAGAGALVGTNVPEPASWILLCICGGLLLAVRRSKPVLLCWAVAMALVCAPTAMAVVIYQDDFSDTAGTIMNGKSLDIAVGVNGGTADAVWDSTDAPVPGGNPSDLWETTGSNSINIGTSGADDTIIENNLLPFTPESGAVYTLHVELNPSGVGASGNWLGIAFHQADYNGHPPGGGSSALSNNDPYGLIILKGSGLAQAFAGLGTADQRINTTGLYTPDTFTPVDIVLDTRPTQWTIDWLINGSPVSGAQFTYTTNPSIGLLSFGTNRLAGSARNFSLTVVALQDGDVDGDGDVDLDDYLVIEGNLFDSATMRADGDLNGDGIVDFLDFREWKANYPYPGAGAGALLGANVPEPASVLLWIIGLVMIGLGYRRPGRRRVAPVLLLLLCGAFYCSPAAAQVEFNDIWTNTGTGNWTDTGNWSLGTVPDVNNDDFAVITNGGTAIVNSTPGTSAGGIRLGEAAGQTGTLEIQSSGNLTAVDDFNAGTAANGSATVGQAGTGLLSVLPGGSLTSVTLVSGGEVGSTITLGSTGAGTAAVNTGAVTLGRTTRVIGPNVNFSATGAMTFQSTSNLIAELTGATHSALKTTGTATLDGALQVEFDYTPSVSDTWNLVDATTIGGSFASVDIVGVSPLAADKALRVRTQAGGTNGNVAQLYVAQLLVLSVDRDSGAVSITNPGTSGVDLDGYGILSAAGSLDSGGWSSLQDQAVTGWAEANPSANHISELNATGVSTLGAGMSWSLGNIYAQATPSQFGEDTEDLVFQYTAPGDDSVLSVVQYSGEPSINNLVLYVDPATGDVNLRNTSSFTVSVEGYTVGSDGGSLQPGDGDWLSLDDQGAEGGTWFEANVSANRVSELQTVGVTTLAPNTTFALGDLFDTAGTQDLVFDFLLGGDSDPTRGVVVYTPPPSVGLIGDYNDDGVVDARDYTRWRDNLGGDGSTLLNRDPANTGTVSEDDYASWKLHFGETLGSGSLLAGSVAVPEPASWILLCISGGLMLAMRRTA